jgi:hypothetical protein
VEGSVLCVLWPGCTGTAAVLHPPYTAILRSHSAQDPFLPLQGGEERTANRAVRCYCCVRGSGGCFRALTHPGVRDAMSHHVMLCHTLYYSPVCYVMSYHIISCHVMPCHVIKCHVISYCATHHCAVLFYVMRQALTYHAIRCATPYHTVLSYSILYHSMLHSHFIWLYRPFLSYDDDRILMIHFFRSHRHSSLHILSPFHI